MAFTRRLGAFAILSVMLLATEAYGQNVQFAPGGRPSREAMEAMRAAAQAQAAQAGQPQPGQQAKPEEKPKEGENKEGEKKEEESKTIKRSTDKPKAEATELKVEPDKDGMVQFNFRGQPWPDVLEWYRTIAKKSLDWQELPADFLNISTSRRYTIDETRDLLNRHLLARGFTMLLQGDGLTVVKTDKIDPSMVPRVEPDDLDDKAPYDFARTRFPIPETMDPAKAVEDVKILLSPTAKVTPLLASKQLQVIDAVTNLRDVRDLLYGEQLTAAKDVRPQPFPIRHRRADYIAQQVMIVLGMDPSSRKEPMELQVEQQRMQLAMQMQQQGKDISKMIKQEGPQVHIAVDKKRNMLLVNAPPKEMEIIKRTIIEFDVPENGLIGAQGLGGGEFSIKQHKMVSVSADAVVNALKEMGNLDPRTQLQSDSRSKTIFAYATEEDHKTIEQMREKLDGSGRKLWPIWLSRRTPADEVAGTIKALMVGEKKKEEQRRPYWYYYEFGRDNEEETDTGFRIQPDVENNRLLLWATQEEYNEVTDLLKQLGAIASDSGSNPNKWRVIEGHSPKETADLLEQLKRNWNGSNRLNITAPPPAETDEAKTPASSKPAVKEEPKDKLTRRDHSGSLPLVGRVGEGVVTRQGSTFATALHKSESSHFRLIADVTPPEEAGSQQAAPATGQPAQAEQSAEKSGDQKTGAPPINVTVTPDGRIVISSDDVAALDQLQDLISELEPARKDFEVFQLYNSRASAVSLNLEEYFADELGDDNNNDFPYWWYDDMPKEEDPATMGKRRKLRFIWDPDTNTIVAQNASPAQLEVIRKLIEIYDQPIDEEAVSKRVTDVITVKYSRAQDIATAIKEVYRDLLSSKDKEFQGKDGERDGGQSRSESRWRFGSSSSTQKTAPMKLSFEGALSIGVDEISNTIIVSAEEQIAKNVRELATALDDKAKPNTIVRVHELRGTMDPEEMQDALSDLMAQPWPGGKPLQARNQAGRNGDNNNRDRGDRGDRGRGDRGDRGRNRD